MYGRIVYSGVLRFFYFRQREFGRQHKTIIKLYRTIIVRNILELHVINYNKYIKLYRQSININNNQ